MNERLEGRTAERFINRRGVECSTVDFSSGGTGKEENFT
jgi:hypothetical protein